MPTQFDKVMKTLDYLVAKQSHLEKLLMQVIHQLGPRLDQAMMRQGLEEEVVEPLFEAEIPSEGDDPIPRTWINYKDNNGEEQRIDYATLDTKVQQVIEIAKEFPDPWSLYETPDGTMRVMVSGEVLSAWNARYA